MAYFKPYFRDFPKLLNNPMMKAWLSGQADAIAAGASAMNVKRTGHNAGSYEAKVESYSGPWHDRAVGVVRNTNTTYGVERELGGRINPKPERALFRAMQGVSGGRAVAEPRIVGGGSARRAKPKPFLNANKHNRGS